MKQDLFTEDMKLADVIIANHNLLYVFPRFGIGLGSGDQTVRQICESKNVSMSLFLLVCNIYTFDDYVPDPKILAQIPLTDLMKYLQNSHKDYLENRMPKIMNCIHDLVTCCNDKHGKTLIQFCEKYRQEVIVHFNYEEQIVFPYIEALIRGENPSGYKIKEYERNHSDLDSALTDLRNIMIKYLPDEFTIEKCCDVLIDLFLFESDLHKHTLLEDHILISLVEHIYPETLNVNDDAEKIVARLKNILQNITSKTSENKGESVDLSEREKEILVAVAKGMTNKEIADKHHISAHTVVSHRKNITRKTGIKTVSGLTIYAVFNNLLN